MVVYFRPPLCSWCPKEQMAIESLLQRPRIVGASVPARNGSDVLESPKRTLSCQGVAYDINVSDFPATLDQAMEKASLCAAKPRMRPCCRVQVYGCK
jgi:hypothetical protein